jgi:hypothetical protein
MMPMANWRRALRVEFMFQDLTLSSKTLKVSLSH